MPIIKRRPVTIDGEERTQIDGIERGMVIRAKVPLRHKVGSEQAHDEDTPWLIVSVNSLHQRQPIVLAAPFTSQMHQAGKLPNARIVIAAKHVTKIQNPWPLHDGDSLVLTEQVRALSHDRLHGDVVARVSKEAMFAVGMGLLYVLNLDRGMKA